MRITIEDRGKRYTYNLPDEHAQKDVTAFVGRQLVLWRRDFTWFGKTAWCNRCGVCCIIKQPDWAHGIKMVDFHGVQLPVCKFLEFDGEKAVCGAGAAVPIGCLTAYSPTPDRPYPYCAVKFDPLIEEMVDASV